MADDSWQRRRSCAKFIHKALVAEMAVRDLAEGLEWVEAERVAVTVAANQWAQAHPPARTVSVADVERVETMAVGHVDYASKLPLYVAELILEPSSESPCVRGREGS